MEQVAPVTATLQSLQARYRAEYDAWFRKLAPSEQAAEVALRERIQVPLALSQTRSPAGTLSSLTGFRMRLPIAGVTRSDTPEQAASKFLAEIASSLGLEDAGALRVVRAHRIGKTIAVRFVQERAGRRVWAAGGTIALDADLFVTSYMGRVAPDVAFKSARVQVSDREAVALARRAAPIAAEHAPPELGYWYPGLVERSRGAARLAYRVDFSAARSLPTRIVVDAGDGGVLETAELGAHATEHKEIFYGITGALQYDDICHVSEEPVCPGGWCTNGVCENPLKSWPGTTQAVKDRANLIYDYWKSFNWWGLDGNGTLPMSVWADQLEESCDANAAGNYINLSPTYACLDVIGHEHTHNVADEAGYGGTQGEIGEAVSDVMGIYAERKMTGSSSWTTATGPGCEPCANAGRHTRLDDPESYVDAPDIGEGQPSNWSNYRFGSGNYHNGTILSHAAFLLGRAPQEGAHTSSGIPVTGVGLDLAGQIWFEALTACGPANTFSGWRNCITSKGCAHGVCAATYDALDAVGIWRDTIDLGWAISGGVGTARRVVNGATEQHVFYRVAGSNTVYWRMRQECIFCTWSAAAPLGLSLVSAPQAAKIGTRIAVCGQQSNGAIACKAIRSDGTIEDLGTNLGATDARVAIVTTGSNSLMLGWRTAGVGAQAIRTRNYYLAKDLTFQWSATTVTSALTTHAPALASGLDEEFPNAVNGTSLVYRRSDGRLAYRKQTTGVFGVEMLVGRVDETPSVLGNPTAAMFRGRLHVAGQQTAGFVRVASCEQPCDSASSWTHWVEQEWASAGYPHLDGRKNLSLYAPQANGLLGYNFKRSK